jgi:hypothetical protein
MAGKSKGRGGRGGKSKSSKSNNSRGATTSSASGASSSNKNVSAPSGESLTLELIGSPGTFDLTKTKSFPAVVGSEKAEGNKLSIHLPSWDALDAIIAWFRDASDSDHEASLSFPSSLAKQHRAKVHSAASAVGLGALVSLSRGVGEDRRITVARRGSTVAKESAAAAVIEDPVLAAKAALLYSWALKDHVEVSRDESVEIMANNVGDNMPEALATVWAAHWPKQEAAERLCMAIAKNDLAEVQSAIEAAPKGALADGSIIDERTGVAPLHLAAGEGNIALVELLLSAGFSPNCKDGAGATALDIAKKYEHSDVQGVLVRAGAVDTEVIPTISESASCTVATPMSLHPVTDSVVSVCGTEASTDKAAEISSVVGDFVDSEYSENGTTSPLATVALTAAAAAGTATVGLSEKKSSTTTTTTTNSEDSTAKKINSKHGKFAVTVPAAVVEATAAVAAKAEDFVAYGKKALFDSRAASTKAIENTKTATLNYGHKAIDGGKAVVESSKAYTVKALESGKSAVASAAEKADENVQGAVNWVKAHSVYILAGTGAIVAAAGVALAIKHRNNTSSRYY